MNRFDISADRVKDICKALKAEGVEDYIVSDKESAIDFVDNCTHYHFAMLALIYKEDIGVVKDMLLSIKSILDFEISYDNDDSLIAKVNQRLLLISRAMGLSSEEKFRVFLSRMYNSCFKASGEFLFGDKTGICKYL